MVSHGADSIFFSLLKAGMYGTPLPEAELPDSIDWKAVTALAHRHAVLGIIIDSVQSLPERLRPPEPIATKMNKFALGLIQANLILDKTVARLVAFFKQHGIEGVLLKGQGVARYYKEPQMRQSGDIDFYVGTTSYNRAVDLCKKFLIADMASFEESQPHCSFDAWGVHIELHRLAARIYSPFKRARFQGWIVEQLEHSSDRRTLTLGNTAVTLPPLEFDVLFIFYHAWHHYIKEGIGLRQLCDWAMIFHSCGDQIDVERLKCNLARFAMTKGWKLFASIAVNYLGVPADKMPLYDPSYRRKSDRILCEIVEGGNFGQYLKANSRGSAHGYGLRYGFGKIGYIARYFVNLFPVTPVEATFLFFHRLFYGAIACTQRSVQKLKH